MDTAVRERIAEHAEPASWQRLVGRSARLAAAHAQPAALADWLDAGWPTANAASAALLRALQAQHWHVARAAPGENGTDPLSFIVHTGNGAWRVRLREGRTLGACHVERVTARTAGNGR